MTEYLRDELRKAVRAGHRKPLIVCGAGVSTQATDGKAPSWAKLIQSGIKRVADLDANAVAWATERQQKLTVGDTATWIAVADEVTERLGGAHNAEFKTWLENEVGILPLKRRDLLDAIFALGCPVATTNYDDLLAKAGNLQPIIWSDHAATHDFLDGRRKGILHLHGHWQSPGRVVLGSTSYGEHSADERRKLLQQIATLDRPTIFIGCSEDGLSDPDFSRLDSFLAEWQDVAPRRYWLIRQDVDEQGDPGTLPSPDHVRRLFPVSYGERHDELIELLRDLMPRAITDHAVTDPDLAIRCIDDYEPRPLIFGRDYEVETLVEALLAGKTAIIAGGPGMGKTAVASAALRDAAVEAHFGRRRVFASLEAATEPRGILAKLVETLGLAPIGDEVTLLRMLEANAREMPIAAILDNAETVFEIDRDEAERLLHLVTQIDGLTLIVTVRGVAPPLPGAVVIDNLPKLPRGPARDAFLSITGASFAGDPDLPPLLEALDGHALSIRLVAAQAVGLPSLKGLRKSWDEAHAEILRRPGEEERRLTSVRASLALSLKSKRMTATPLAHRLMALLAFLPGGLGETDVKSLVGGRGTVSTARANEAVFCLHQLRLIERRLDNRLRMLTPLRECVKLDLAPLNADQGRLIDHYLSLATKADSVGSKTWENCQQEVELEADNLDAVCDLAITTDFKNRRLQGALIGLSEFHKFSGLGAVGSLARAVERLRHNAPSRMATTCILHLGQIARSRSDHETALARYEEALALYRRIGAVLGEAESMVRYGQVRRSVGDSGRGISEINAGFVLYFRVAGPKDRAAPGWLALQDALICTNAADAQKYRELARTSWMAIGRLDLVRQWIESEEDKGSSGEESK
jgi:tetratricopeptide (TPR) repeat protein